MRTQPAAEGIWRQPDYPGDHGQDWPHMQFVHQQMAYAPHAGQQGDDTPLARTASTPRTMVRGAAAELLGVAQANLPFQPPVAAGEVVREQEAVHQAGQHAEYAATMWHGDTEDAARHLRCARS